jgi:phospholipid/cholesterol/gamma-HCH transport system substrate-binding protein
MKKFLLSIFGGPVVHGHRTVSAWKLGLGFLIVVLIVGTAVFNKARLTTWLTPGNTVNVHFAQDYRLRPYFSQAKIAFVPVGMVTGDTELDDHTALVTVKLYGDNINKLGDNPSVTIRPTTMLGGNYMIDFQPGGDLSKPFTKGEIPVNQAHLPEELDKIIATFQPNALAGMKGTLTKFDDTLKGGTKEALQRFVHDAPDSLKPAGQVLDALRGKNPESDLTDVVSGLEATSQQLSNPRGRLDAIVVDLNKFSTTFGQHSADFSTTLDELPSALDSAQRGLHRLNITLDVLDDTADDIRPMARQLDHTLGHIDPILHRARPVIEDLRDVLHDARPLVRHLAPDLRDLDDVLDRLHGPVLDRLNGPIEQLLTHSFTGTGPYSQSITKRPVFQEVVYAATNLDRASSAVNNNGSMLAFQPWLFQGEPLDGAVANNGQPRTETFERSLTDPLRINPPVQSPGESPHASPGKSLLPMMGASPISDKEGR